MAKPDRRDEVHNCVIKPRENPKRRRERVYVGCGAGFGGDRPYAALKLLQRVAEIDYLVLECLAERTLAERWRIMASGGDGYDSRVSEWMHLLLPLAVEKGTCIITNMGAIDPSGAQKKVIEIASELGLNVSVAVAREVHFCNSGTGPSSGVQDFSKGGISTYLGAAPIVECLEKYQPNVIITSRVADAALFLAPMVYELGWDWDDLELLAQGTLAGHLLECGCQLTGGYFMHPGDQYRDMSFPLLLDLSLPYVEISFDGNLSVLKAEGIGGVLNSITCAEQLLYEVGDPGSYITPDVVIDIRDVSFLPLSDFKVQCSGAKPSAGLAVPEKLLQLVPKDCGWKGWGEISYGGKGCLQRAKASEYLVRSWMEETVPGVNDRILSYIIGLDSVMAISNRGKLSSWQPYADIRLRMDGLFELKEHAVQLTREFTALYTNGPAGGGGISTGHWKEISLEKHLVSRESVFWKTGVQHTSISKSVSHEHVPEDAIEKFHNVSEQAPAMVTAADRSHSWMGSSAIHPSPAPSGQKIPLYAVAHSRAGDKGNDLNFSIIPHHPSDIKRLKLVITPQWVKDVMSVLSRTSSFLDTDVVTKRDEPIDDEISVEVYDVRGIHSLNVVVRNILDGGVNCSRRIDRHGKTISDLILCQQVLLP